MSNSQSNFDSFYEDNPIYQAGKDAQLKECCAKLRERFDGSLGISRSKGISDWLYDECRPSQGLDLREQLLNLVDTCPQSPETIDLRKRVEALPVGLATGQEDYD